MTTPTPQEKGQAMTETVEFVIGAIWLIGWILFPWIMGRWEKDDYRWTYASVRAARVWGALFGWLWPLFAFTILIGAIGKTVMLLYKAVRPTHD
jgi:hypothetical protein